MHDDLEDPPGSGTSQLNYLCYLFREALREEGISCHSASDDFSEPYLVVFGEGGAVGRRLEIDPDLPGLVGGFWTGNQRIFDMSDPAVFNKIKAYLRGD